MCYENAPATRLVATHCAICNRPLVDAQSVETGVGPICRKRYMAADAVSPEARTEANKLVYQIAQLCSHKSVSDAMVEVTSAVDRLKSLGCIKLAERIEKRIQKYLRRVYPVRISYEEDRVVLRTRNIEDHLWDAWLSALQRIPGRKWEPEKGKANTFPMDQKRSIFALLKRFFSGAEAWGPKGVFVI